MSDQTQTTSTTPAGAASVLSAGLGGMAPAAWMYKNANTANWYLRWEEAKDRLSVPLYTPEQIAEIVASEHRHQKLLEENCRILRQEIAQLEASPMSEEALDILRSENAALRAERNNAEKREYDALGRTAATEKRLDCSDQLLREEWAAHQDTKTDLKEYAENILTLLETVKYLIGIAERGEGRAIRVNETAETFVLGYVKRLEAKVGSGGTAK